MFGAVAFYLFTDGYRLNQRQFNFVLIAGGPLVWLLRYASRLFNAILRLLK